MDILGYRLTRTRWTKWKTQTPAKKKVDRTLVIVSVVLVIISVGLVYVSRRTQESQGAASSESPRPEASKPAQKPKVQPLAGHGAPAQLAHNPPPKAQSSETLVKLVSGNCQAIKINADFCRKVWKRIEWTTGEVSWVDMDSIRTGRAYVVTGQDGAPLYESKISSLQFDCHGHFDGFNSDGSEIPLQDAPPRSIAGEIAKIVCTTRSVPNPRSLNTPSLP